MQTWNPKWRSQLEGQGLSAFSNFSRVLFHDIYNFFGKLKFTSTYLNFYQTIFSRPMVQQRLIMRSKSWKFSVWSKQWSYLMRNIIINLIYKGQLHDYQLLDFAWNWNIQLIAFKIRQAIRFRKPSLVFKFLLLEGNAHRIFMTTFVFVIRAHTLDHVRFMSKRF